MSLTLSVSLLALAFHKVLRTVLATNPKFPQLQTPSNSPVVCKGKGSHMPKQRARTHTHAHTHTRANNHQNKLSVRLLGLFLFSFENTPPSPGRARGAPPLWIALIPPLPPPPRQSPVRRWGPSAAAEPPGRPAERSLRGTSNYRDKNLAGEEGNQVMDL